jgi:hypothetical protein
MRLSFILLVVLSAPASAQQPRRTAASPVTGTYGKEGCRLEVAPVATDSVHVQLRCTRPAPTFNLGFLDERLPIQSGVVRHDMREPGGRCRIIIRFAGEQAVVTQDGTDLSCGFGGGVYVNGRYRRISRRLPSFDLDPCGPQ